MHTVWLVWARLTTDAMGTVVKLQIQHFSCKSNSSNNMGTLIKTNNGKKLNDAEMAVWIAVYEDL